MVRLEFMYFLPLLGAGKAGEVHQGERAQLTDQHTVSFTAGQRVKPGE